MKYLRLIIMFLSVMAFCGACHRSVFEETQDAALALYCKYADNERLLVAYVGDLKVEDHAVNAVMIQANDDKNWDWLQNEFAVERQVRMVVGDTLTEMAAAVELGMEWNTPMVVSDSIILKAHLSDEEIEIFADAIVDQLNATINQLLANNTEVSHASILISDDVSIMSDMDFGVEFSDTTAMSRIMQSVAIKLNEEGLAYNDTALGTETAFAQIEPRESIMENAKQHGQEGYVTAVDYSNRTLWVFFYDCAEECQCIMTHIRKDIFAYPAMSIN